MLERIAHNPLFLGTVQLVRRYFAHRVARDSAALTYYLLFAIFPLLIFLSNLVGIFAVDIEGFLRSLGTIIPGEVLDLLVQYLRYVSSVSSRTLMTFSLVFSVWFPMRAANALLLSVRKAYGLGRPTHFLRHQLKVFLYTICLFLTILLSLVLVTVGHRVLDFCADFFNFSAFLNDGFIEVWSSLRFVLLGVLVFLALAVLYGLAQETRSVHFIWPGVLFSLAAWMLLFVLCGECLPLLCDLRLHRRNHRSAFMALPLCNHDDHGSGVQQCPDVPEKRPQPKNAHRRGGIIPA